MTHPDLCLCTHTDLQSSEPALQAREAGEDERQWGPYKNTVALTAALLGKSKHPVGLAHHPRRVRGVNPAV